MKENEKSLYEQKIFELEEKLESSKREEERLRNIFDNVQDVFYQVDLDGTILEISPSVSFFSEFSREELIGQNVFVLYSNPEEREHLLCVIKQNGRIDDYELKLKSKNGNTFYVSVNAQLLCEDQGGRQYINGSLRNISKRKEIEVEIKEKNQKLKKLIEEKDKFFSIISHDLRTPFNSFLGFTEILLEDAENMNPKEVKDIASILNRSAKDMFSLLENLLELSRIQSYSVQLKPEYIAAFYEIKATIESLSDLFQKKEITIEYNIPYSLQVYADNIMLKSVIRNLVINAIKFTPRGGKIIISSSKKKSETQISIADTGIGMNKDILNSLFEIKPITRKGTENEPTSGLGLLICKELIKKHGGEIFVESEEGKGSTFSFVLPNN